MAIIDQFSDPAFANLFHAVERMPGVEAFTKTASVDASERDTLPDSAFAWPQERKFPLHTPEHAALSFAYTKLSSVIPDGVLSNLRTALDVYGIEAGVFEEKEKVASADKAPPSVDYVLPTFQYLPIKTAADCHSAQDRLAHDLPKLDMTHRATACANLVKLAQEHGVPLRPEFQQLAGLVVSSTKVAQDWIQARVVALDKLKVANADLLKQAYQKLADGVGSLPPESADRKGLLKVASVVAELDERAGLDKFYDRKLPDAMRTVFNTTKLAGSSVDLNGTFVPVSKLAQLPASVWEDLGGSELANEIAPGGHVDVSKLATVVDTLPLDLKVQLQAYVR